MTVLAEDSRLLNSRLRGFVWHSFSEKGFIKDLPRGYALSAATLNVCCQSTHALKALQWYTLASCTFPGQERSMSQILVRLPTTCKNGAEILHILEHNISFSSSRPTNIYIFGHLETEVIT